MTPNFSWINNSEQILLFMITLVVTLVVFVGIVTKRMPEGGRL